MCVRIVFVLVLCCVNSWARKISLPDSWESLENPNITSIQKHEMHLQIVEDPKPPDLPATVKQADLPQDIQVSVLPHNTGQELQFNVSWIPPKGIVTGYDLEAKSLTGTTDCLDDFKKPLQCYNTDILGNSTWSLIPVELSSIAGSCELRPGCTYRLALKTTLRDGSNTAYFDKEIQECEAGKCSCAYWDLLPVPTVSAKVVTISNKLFINITWSLPKPQFPKRLPSGLKKHSYVVGLRKQHKVSEILKSWYGHYVVEPQTREANGLVADGDSENSMYFPFNNTNVEMSAEVFLKDERGCYGPLGRHKVAADSEDSVRELSIGAYAILLALFVSAWTMGAVFVVGTRVVKRVLKSFRPASVSAPLEPITRHPAWLPLQRRSNNEIPSRGQMEESPLYTQKEFEIEGGDEWEVSRTRVHLGSVIGSGAFGRVHSAQLDMPGGETITVAAKMLSEVVSEEEVQDFLGEIMMLKHVGSHKHVIRLIACCTRQAPYIALLEHAPRGDLLSLLRAARARRKDSLSSNVTRKIDSSQARPSEADSEYTNLSDSDPALSDGDGKLYADFDKKKDHYVAEPALQLDGSTMREYALQVALGMRHLEERGITHRDLAARNILVDGAGLLKVADFGLSRSGLYVHTRSRPVPLRWLAPEAILHSQYCGASDVWAFAVLLWEIATLGGFPYAELSNHHVPSFLAGGGRLPKPARASPTLYQLMVECWAENPTQRPTFSEIVDKLTVQKQLYIDLDCVFPPSEDELEDYWKSKKF